MKPEDLIRYDGDCGYWLFDQIDSECPQWLRTGEFGAMHVAEIPRLVAWLQLYYETHKGQ